METFFHGLRVGAAAPRRRFTRGYRPAPQEWRLRPRTKIVYRGEGTMTPSSGLLAVA